jgi:hypothetical protein
MKLRLGNWFFGLISLFPLVGRASSLSLRVRFSLWGLFGLDVWNDLAELVLRRLLCGSLNRLRNVMIDQFFRLVLIMVMLVMPVEGRLMWDVRLSHLDVSTHLLLLLVRCRNHRNVIAVSSCWMKCEYRRNVPRLKWWHSTLTEVSLKWGRLDS